MKQIKLKKLIFRNFKGLRDFEIAFDDVTTVMGMNGTGKSTLFNGFLWLLFGKDVQDRKDYEIRTRNADNTLIHEVECSVTGVLEIDGQELTIKRESVEEWVKPRGQADRVLKGTHNECWWNETPIKVSEYDARIAEILEPSLFKMITNPIYFATMNWKLQREELFRLAGTITDEEIASDNPEFKVLLDKLTGKSLADFKKELASKKKRLKAELAEVQPRIDQTQKMMPESEDFTALEAEIAQVDKEIAEIDKILSDNAARIRAEYQAEQAKQRRVNDLMTQRDDLIREAEQKAKETAFEANANRREIEMTIASKKRELALLEQTVLALLKSFDRHENEIATLEKLIDEKRNEWHKENTKAYSGDDICHHCGQVLPQEMRDKNLEDFKATQKANKDKIQSEGKDLAERQNVERKLLQSSANEIADHKIEIDKLKAEIKDAEGYLANMPETATTTVVPEEVPGYADLTKKIEEAKAAILIVSKSNNNDSEYQEKKKALIVNRDSLKKRLAVRDEIKRGEKEIENLAEQGKQIAQQIADLEKEEYIVQEFTHKKIEECESRINGFFHKVRFQLFDKTFEGDLYETCIPLVDGVPFGSANTAGQINAGLDIINTLCRFYNICAPIFIDNRESVINLIPTIGQIINLEVSHDNKLTIKQ